MHITASQKKNYLGYMSDTLMPQLHDEGYHQAACCIGTMLDFIEGSPEAMLRGEWFSKKEFIAYLEDGLIPALKRDGDENVALDFETGLYLLKRPNNPESHGVPKPRTKLRGKTRDLASKYIAEEIATKQYPRKQAIAIVISRARAAAKKVTRR